MIKNLLLVLFSAARLGGHEESADHRRLAGCFGPCLARASTVSAHERAGGKYVLAAHHQPGHPPVNHRPPPNTAVIDVSNHRMGTVSNQRSTAQHITAEERAQHQKTTELYQRHNVVPYGKPTNVHGTRPQIFASRWEGSRSQMELTQELMRLDEHQNNVKAKRTRGPAAQEKSTILREKVSALEEKRAAMDLDQFLAESLLLEAELSQESRPLHDALAEHNYTFNRNAHTTNENKLAEMNVSPYRRNEMGRALENTNKFLELHTFGEQKKFGVMPKHLRQQVEDAQEMMRLHKIANGNLPLAKMKPANAERKLEKLQAAAKKRDVAKKAENEKELEAYLIAKDKEFKASLKAKAQAEKEALAKAQAEKKEALAEAKAEKKEALAKLA